MGCSSSRTSLEDNETNNRLKQERDNYNSRHEKFESLYHDVLSTIRKAIDPVDPDIILKVTKELKSQKVTNQMPDRALVSSIEEFNSYVFIEDNCLVQNYDIYESAFSKAEASNLLPENILNLGKLLIESFSRIYPRLQKGVYLNFEDHSNKSLPLLKGIFTNLKFNKSLSLDLISVVANNYFLKHDELYNGLADLITIGSSLSSFFLLINDSETDEIAQSTLLNLNPIFKSLCKNNSIKFLLIAKSNNATTIGMTNEMEKCILSILQKDTLFGLYIGGFSFSEAFFKQLTVAICNVKKLKILLIESDFDNLNLLDDFVIQGIGRNRSIQVVVFAGTDLGENKVNDYKQVQKHNDTLKIFEYVQQIKEYYK